MFLETAIYLNFTANKENSIFLRVINKLLQVSKTKASESPNR